MGFVHQMRERRSAAGKRIRAEKSAASEARAEALSFEINSLRPALRAALELAAHEAKGSVRIPGDLEEPSYFRELDDLDRWVVLREAANRIDPRLRVVQIPVGRREWFVSFAERTDAGPRFNVARLVYGFTGLPRWVQETPREVLLSHAYVRLSPGWGTASERATLLRAMAALEEQVGD